MGIDFSAAMARATAATRERNLGEATRIIGEALGLRSAVRDEAPANGAAPADAATIPEARGAAPKPRLDPEAEVVEPVTERRAEAEAETPAEPVAEAAPETFAADAATEATGPFAALLKGRRAGRGLGEVVRLLGEGKRGLAWPGLGGAMPDMGSLANLPGMGNLPGMAGGREPEVPEGARFETRRFACAAGAREYRLYVPATLAEGEAPKGVVLMLHGCKQNPEDFAIGTGMNARAEAEGMLVIYPRQTTGDNSSGCWNWFRPGDQRRDAGEPAILAGLTREVVAEFGADPGRVFVAGLSAGGAMAAVLAESYPEVFAAAGIHSGLPTGAARDVVSAFAAMRGDGGGATGPVQGRRIVFQGTADRTVAAVNAARLVPGLDAAPTVGGQSAGGRAFTRAAVAGPDGAPSAELWMIDGAGHAWAGGQTGGSYTDPAGPDASAEMVRFFLGRAAG